MYTQEQMALLEKVEQLQKEKSLSQNAVGQLIGVSGAAISQLKKETYPSDPQKLFAKIASYFEIKEQAQKTYSEIFYAETNISEQIYSILSNCQIKGGLATVVGDAGIGKTRAAQKFAMDNPNKCVMITANTCITTVKALLETLTERLNATPERSPNKMWNAIMQKLSDGMILIFDEAQHLTIKEIETLRSFSDAFTDRGQTLGICFIGNPETIAHMNKKAEFAQISNRTKQSVFYTRSQIQRSDIVKLFQVYNESDNKKEIELLFRIAHSQQAIRGAVNLFSNAYDNGNCTYDGLIAMAKFMHMEI